MRAFQVTGFDTPPGFADLPKPSPASGQVLIRVAACGLNFADLLMAKGTYQETPEPPFTLGLEVSGTVVAGANDVGHLPVGTRVLCFAGQGGLAEYLCMDAARCRPLPKGMPDTIAAGFQVAYGTSRLALTRRARMQPGETLLVLGAAGGVGLTAVEVGKAMGARVIAVARGAEKLEVAKRAGADHLIDAGADLTAELRALGGVDVIYDPIGGDATVAALRALKPEGRLIVIGFASGDVPALKANHLLVKNQDVLGFYWGGYLNFNPGALMDSLDELMAWHADGTLSPHISHILPFDRVEEGLDMLRNRTSTGKVVIAVSPEAEPA